MSTREKIGEIYSCLLDRYGQQHWWPGESRFEVIIGAILTQNTNWNNVEKAIQNLKSRGLLDAVKLYECPDAVIAELIRPAGYYNIKAKRIRNLLRWLMDNYEGDLDRVAGLSKYSLREELMQINGIGRETADSILLYAFEKSVFVVDAYTSRILGRHGLIDEYFDYEQIRELFENALPNDAALFNEFHALIVRVGKEHCKKRPTCKGCPLEHLPHEIPEMDD